MFRAHVYAGQVIVVFPIVIAAIWARLSGWRPPRWAIKRSHLVLPGSRYRFPVCLPRRLLGTPAPCRSPPLDRTNPPAPRRDRQRRLEEQDEAVVLRLAVTRLLILDLLPVAEPVRGEDHERLRLGDGVK